jgi:threonine synthase
VTYLGYLHCVRCGAEVAADAGYGGCPDCVAAGVPANALPAYALSTMDVDPGQPGIFRYRALLPLDAGTPVVSLGEGGTPLLRTRNLGALLGVERLYVKDETRNPTWSYKDRLAAVAVSRAAADGADTVVVATTGNHGAAVAAYAAAAGLRCVVLTLESVPQTMKTLMQVYGAEVVALRTGPQRWQLMAEAVRDRGWVPMSGFRNPPVGSNPFGVDGYKTIAYELAEQLGTAPDVVVVPTAYADGLAGIGRGFADLRALGVIERLPRLVAAEPFGPYSDALGRDADVAGPVPAGPSAAFSIASPVGTYQGLAALRASGGEAVAVPDDAEILSHQALAGRAEGLYLEAASALAVAAVGRLAAAGRIGAHETVVVIGTSSGLKDVGATAAGLPAVPVIEPDLTALDAALGAVRR